MSVSAYAQVKNLPLFRALIGPEPEKAMTATQLAQSVNITLPFVSHLLAGRRTRVSTQIAELIAGALRVPVGLLFEPALSTTRQQKAKPRNAA
jgi:hypothetical protein